MSRRSRGALGGGWTEAESGVSRTSLGALLGAQTEAELTIDERTMNEKDEESKENDEETSKCPKGDYVYEEKLKIDMLVDKTEDPVHVRNQAIIVLSRLFEGDMSRRLVPFFQDTKRVISYSKRRILYHTPKRT